MSPSCSPSKTMHLELVFRWSFGVIFWVIAYKKTLCKLLYCADIKRSIQTHHEQKFCHFNPIYTTLCLTRYFITAYQNVSGKILNVFMFLHFAFSKKNLSEQLVKKNIRKGHIRGGRARFQASIYKGSLDIRKKRFFSKRVFVVSPPTPPVSFGQSSVFTFRTPLYTL